MTELPSPFYSESPGWHAKIGEIHAALERVKISEERSADVLHLRRLNRIASIHSSTAIEGNQLTLEQVSDVINGKPVWGPPKDIQEVQNAWDAYGGMGNYDPWSVDDLLKAHALLTATLIAESGRFRSLSVAVVRGDGVVLHRGTAAHRVPREVDRLLAWGRTTEAHPLIASSAIHYGLEHIHPFSDGNGRIGRLWQTLILSKWSPLFTWMPIETLVHRNQARYYKALHDSHTAGVDCRPFIDFMLEAIGQSLSKYVAFAAEAGVPSGRVPENVPENVPVNPIAERLLVMLRANPKASAQHLAQSLGVADKTIKRHFKALQEAGRLRRVGPDKGGHWEVTGT